MLRLMFIMEEQDDLYDELIIDRVIGLAIYWVKEAQGFCRQKRAIILLCVASKGQTADQIFTMKRAHTISPGLIWLTSQKVSMRSEPHLLAVTLQGLVNMAANMTTNDAGGENDVHQGVSTVWQTNG